MSDQLIKYALIGYYLATALCIFIGANTRDKRKPITGSSGGVAYLIGLIMCIPIAIQQGYMYYRNGRVTNPFDMGPLLRNTNRPLPNHPIFTPNQSPYRVNDGYADY